MATSSGPYQVGQNVKASTVLTVAGVATNATVAITVTAPDGTQSTPTVVNSSTGNYYAIIPIDQAGRWLYRWVASGAATAADEAAFAVYTKETA